MTGSGVLWEQGKSWKRRAQACDLISQASDMQRAERRPGNNWVCV